MIEDRPWGSFEIIHADENTWLKKLRINPGQSLSLQSHEHRTEFWYTEDEGVEFVLDRFRFNLVPGMPAKCPARTKHRLANTGQEPVTVIEWAVGRPDEADITRLEDDYGRA